MTSSNPTADQLRLPAAKPAHAALADALRRQILLGTYPVGVRLPTERDIAPALGVSRNTARQAIKILAELGLVRTTLGRNGGSVVIEPPLPARNRRAVLTRWCTQMQDALDVRLAIEPLAARWAAERGTAPQRRAIAKMAATETVDALQYEEFEAKFHNLVAAAGRDVLLVSTIASSHENVFEEASSLWIKNALGDVGAKYAAAKSSFADDHRAIGDAIGSQNGPAAQAAMTAHLKRLSEDFAAMITAALADQASDRPKKAAR